MHQEVPNREVEEETVETQKDKYWNRLLVIGCLRRPKKRSKGDGGPGKSCPPTGHCGIVSNLRRCHKHSPRKEWKWR